MLSRFHQSNRKQKKEISIMRRSFDRLAIQVAGTLAFFLPVSALAAPTLPLPPPKVGELVGAFELFRPQPDANLAAKQASAIAELMRGSSMEMPDIGGASEDEWYEAGPKDSNLLVRWQSSLGELRVLDLAVIADAGVGDVGEKAALEIARKQLEKLAARDVIDLAHYAPLTDPESFDIGYVRMGDGSVENPDTSGGSVSEYRVTLRRRLNGIEMANTGVRVSIHASGATAGIRLGGVSVVSAVDPSGLEMPVGKGELVPVQQSADEIRADFMASLPSNAELRPAWESVLYVLPDDVNHAVVGPMHVFAYSLAYHDDTEGTSVSRGKVVGYSYVESELKQVDFLPPTPPDPTHVESDRFSADDADQDGVADGKDVCPDVFDPNQLDQDQDGVGDACDNCLEVPNADQTDRDADGYGNRCDADFDGNGSVNGLDFIGPFLESYHSGVDDGNGTDMDGNGVVNGSDFTGPFLDQFSKGAPGPSGMPCAGGTSCP